MKIVLEEPATAAHVGRTPAGKESTLTRREFFPVESNRTLRQLRETGMVDLAG